MILLSLLVQGPLLPAITRWARLPADETAADEYELAERTITGAAVAAIDDIAAEHGVSDAVRDRARREGYEMLELSNARAYARQSAADDARIAELETALGQTDATGAGSGGTAESDPSSADAPASTSGEGAAPASVRRLVVPSAHDTGAAAGGSGPAASLEMLAESDGVDLTQRSPLTRFDETMRLKLALIDRKRTVLQRLRREGTIDDLVVRRVEARLDLDELRLRGVDQTG